MDGGFAKEELVEWGGGIEAGNGCGFSEPAVPEDGLPRDDRWPQGLTQSSGYAAGLKAGKGLRTPAFCRVGCMSSEGLCTSTERPLAEMGMAQDGVGKPASRWGPREVLGR